MTEAIEKNSDTKIYPVGLNRGTKDAVLSLIPDGHQPFIDEVTSKLATRVATLLPEEDRLNPDNLALVSHAVEQAREALLNLIPEGNRKKANKLLRTSEEIAVIFAKISRTPGSFEEIAEGVDEEGAAKFHGKWTVTTEGYGHKSVGEHAMIHTAVENVTSLDGDEITDNRLGAFTEFSARFTGRQNVGYYTSRTALADPELHAKWDAVHKKLFSTCDDLTSKARAWIFTDEAMEIFPELKQRESENDGKWKARLRKAASDGFKDMLPASRYTSIGVTLNATEEENVLRKMQSAPAMETRRVGRLLKEAAIQVAPTLVKYAEFNPYLASLNTRRELLVERFGLDSDMEWLMFGNEYGPKTLVHPSDVETAILAGFAFESSRTSSFQHLEVLISRKGAEEKKKMFDLILNEEVVFNDPERGMVRSTGLEEHDMPPRAFELDGSYLVEMSLMTYGIWREYKRHRMQTYIAKPLDTRLGYMTPPLAQILDESSDVSNHGSVALVKNVMDELTDFHRDFQKIDPVDARLLVARLYNRPAIAEFNPREAYHLLKLRTGGNAHPYIKELMWPVVDAMREEMPNALRYLKLRGKRSNVAFP